MKKYKNGILVLMGCVIIMAMLFGVIVHTNYELEHIEPDVVYEMANKNITWEYFRD